VFPQYFVRQKQLHGESVRLPLVHRRRKERVRAEVGERDALMENGVAELVGAGETLLRFGERRVDMNEPDPAVSGAAAPRAAEVAVENVDAQSVGDGERIIRAAAPDEDRNEKYLYFKGSK